MKKFFTLIAGVLMAMGAQAQTVTYNFSDATSWGAYPEGQSSLVYSADKTVGNLTLKAGEGKDTGDKLNETWTIDNSNKTIEGVKYTRRAKSGGSTNTNGTRTMALVVDGPCNINVAACSSSSSETRTLAFATTPVNKKDAEGVIATFDLGSNPEVCTLHYNGEAGTVYICNCGGLNYYFVKVGAYTKPVEPVMANQTWDFSEFENDEETGIVFPYNYNNLNIVLTYDATKDYIGKKGLHGNGDSKAGNRIMSLTPGVDGTLKVTFQSNKAEDAANRTSAIGTKFVASATATSEGVVALETAETGEMSAAVKANQIYYIWFAKGGQTFTKVEFVAGGTGIQNINAAKAANDAAIYNLAGQKVSNSFKGIAIQNGRKVVIK